MIDLKIITNKSEYNIKCEKGASLKEIIYRENINFMFPCGGRGKCGNCKVKVVKGINNYTKLDEIKINKCLLKENYRLACGFYLKEDTEIILKEHTGFSL